MGSLGSHHAGATAKPAFALRRSPTDAAPAAPCREDPGGQVPKGVAEGMDACSFLLHVCDSIFTGALQHCRGLAVSAAVCSGLGLQSLW